MEAHLPHVFEIDMKEASFDLTPVVPHWVRTEDEKRFFGQDLSIDSCSCQRN